MSGISGAKIKRSRIKSPKMRDMDDVIQAMELADKLLEMVDTKLTKMTDLVISIRQMAEEKNLVLPDMSGYTEATDELRSVRSSIKRHHKSLKNRGLQVQDKSEIIDGLNKIRQFMDGVPDEEQLH